jgi:hypothetical protein
MGPEIRFQNRGRKLLQELRIFDYIIRKYALGGGSNTIQILLVLSK